MLIALAAQPDMRMVLRASSRLAPRCAAPLPTHKIVAFATGLGDLQLERHDT